ncbi:qin [Carabus blaptoides fortunei]
MKHSEIICDRCKCTFQVTANAVYKPSFGPKSSVLNGISPAGAVLRHVVNRPGKDFNQNGPKVTRKLVPKETIKDVCSQHDCRKRADFRCVNCVELYCAKCDKRVHESIKILRNHTRYPIHIANLADFNECCIAHSHKVADYICESCENSMFCSKCIIEDHQGHTFASVEDMNRKELPQFVEAMDKAKYVLKTLETSRNKVKEELLTHRQSRRLTHVEHNIIKHFANVHSRLQLLEEQMLSELHKAQSRRAEVLEHVRQDLEDNIAIMTPLVATGQLVLRKHEHLDKLILSQLHQHVVNNLSLPCAVLDIDKAEMNVDFEADDSFLDTLTEHCRISAGASPVCKLSPITDFTNIKCQVSDDSASTASTDTDVSSMQSSPKVITRKHTPAEPNRHVPPLKKMEMYKDSEEPVVFQEGTKESVKVTHLISPSFFYIQLARKQKEIARMTDKYELYAQYAAVPEEISLGKTYLVQYIHKDFKKWYRAAVRERFADDTYQVFYIDYGNCEQVPRDRFREIKPMFMQTPAYAYRCRIGGLVPTKNDWTDDVLQYMILFCTGDKHLPLIDLDQLSGYLITGYSQHLDMVVERNHKTTIDVDLFVNGSSLIAGLLFTGFAANIAPRTPQSAHNYMHSLKRKLIMPSVANYFSDQVYSVYVTNVLSPQHLYIQKADNRKIIEKIEHDMTVTLNREKNSNIKYIFSPEKGMNCAANLAFDGKWHRVLVVDLPGVGQVEVQALDHGITEVVGWDQLRSLKEHLIKTDAQAIKVSLVDIAPLQNDTWTPEAMDYLQKRTKNKILKMYVAKTSREQLEVALYESEPNMDICINALLVREAFAKSTGDSSLLVEFHKLPEPTGIRQCEKNYAEKLISSIQTYDREKSEETAGMDSFTARKHHENVEILHIESPSSFYVTALKWTDERRRFSRKLTKFYAELTSCEYIWTAGDLCVVNSMKNRNFYRGIVKKVLDNGQFEVFLKDVARTETIPSCNMFQLDARFKKPDFSLHCCLAGVQPAGGTGKWPAIAVEYFNDMVNKYTQLSMTKVGRIVDKVLPVNLVAYIEENNGPLEPSTIKTVVLNKCLLDNGLALPLKVELDEEPEDPQENDNLFLASIQKANTPVRNALSPDPAFELHDSVEIRPNKTEHSAWPSPERITKEVFKAWPMYVDHAGHVYLHTERSRHMLNNIKRCMRQFERTAPDPPHPWEPGQMCTVQYHLDNAFCRGQVLKNIAPDKWLVKLVDYGNEEECSHEELRSNILLPDVPIIATQCMLDGVVSPDGSWPLDVLDKLHFIIVDKECTARIVEPASGDRQMTVRLQLDNICVNSEVMTWNWTQADANETQLSSDDNDVVIEDVDDNASVDEELYEEISDIADILAPEVDTYTRMTIPADMSSFEAMVINVLDHRHVVIEPCFLADSLRETEHHFAELLDDINTSAAEQMALECFDTGTPCVGQYSHDKRWYRAEIYETPDENATTIKVMFVDYGNLDIVAKENLRQMKTEWIAFPVLMLKCKIWGITKPEEVDEHTASSALADRLYDKKHICQIKAATPELEVKFIDPETYEIVYKDAIDSGILISIA